MKKWVFGLSMMIPLYLTAAYGFQKPEPTLTPIQPRPAYSASEVLKSLAEIKPTLEKALTDAEKFLEPWDASKMARAVAILEKAIERATRPQYASVSLTQRQLIRLGALSKAVSPFRENSGDGFYKLHQFYQFQIYQILQDTLPLDGDFFVQAKVNGWEPNREQLRFYLSSLVFSLDLSREAFSDFSIGSGARPQGDPRLFLTLLEAQSSYLADDLALFNLTRSKGASCINSLKSIHLSLKKIRLHSKHEDRVIFDRVYRQSVAVRDSLLLGECSLQP